ncbi:MAG: 7TM-DISM domain-containing protein [Bacteroidia bacterium]|nr:7TM-DISM domain-containing protein [Bacteroidia bacterium]
MKKLLFIILLVFAGKINLSAQSLDVMILAEKGRECYLNKQYRLSAEIFELTMIKGNVKLGEVYYNTACSWALAGFKQNAYRNLDSCIKYNWTDTALTEKDPDLVSLHADAEWTAFITKFKQKLTDDRNKKLEQTPTYFWGIYLGILIVFFLYNLMMFFSIRDVTYLYYSLSIFFLSQSHAVMIPHFGFYAREVFVWLNNFPIRKETVFPFATLVIIFHLLFVRGFINLKKRHPKLNKYNNYLIVVLSIICVPVAFLPKSEFIYFPFFIIAYAYALHVAVYSWRKGFKPSRFLVIGSIFLTIGITLVLMPGLGLPDLRFSLSVFRCDILGFLSFYMFLSFALGDKINVLTREKAEAQEKALEELEVKVQERTAELAHEKQLVEEKQKDILDSIRYAKRIQTSLMPNEKYLNGIFSRRKK